VAAARRRACALGPRHMKGKSCSWANARARAIAALIIAFILWLLGELAIS
jgi:hypothetical protein